MLMDDKHRSEEDVPVGEPLNGVGFVGMFLANRNAALSIRAAKLRPHRFTNVSLLAHVICLALPWELH